MILYECVPVQFFQVFDYVKEKWYNPRKLIPRKEKEIRMFNEKLYFIYAENEQEAEDKYKKLFGDIEKLNDINYYHYDYNENYKIKLDDLQLKTVIAIYPYEDNHTIDYLKSHMSSNDFLYYCRKELNLEYAINQLVK